MNSRKNDFQGVSQLLYQFHQFSNKCDLNVMNSTFIRRRRLPKKWYFQQGSSYTSALIEINRKNEREKE